MVRALVTVVPWWVQHAEVFVIGSISSSFLCVSYRLELLRLLLALTPTLVPNLDFHGSCDYPVRSSVVLELRRRLKYARATTFASFVLLGFLEIGQEM